MIMNDKLRVVLDTTVFCGALVNPDGGNMQCLLLANGPFFDPVIAQTVLAEFVHVATVRGIRSGRNRRIYTYDEIQRFLESVTPLLERAVPVGLRDILPHVMRWPYLPLSHAFQNLVARWPAGEAATFDPSIRVSTIDLKDAHVILAAVEHRAEIIVTSNTKDFQLPAAPWRVETPREFLRRWIIDAD
jgi:predicted nucleic acid-binding protein